MESHDQIICLVLRETYKSPVMLHDTRMMSTNILNVWYVFYFIKRATQNTIPCRQK